MSIPTSCRRREFLEMEISVVYRNFCKGALKPLVADGAKRRPTTATAHQAENQAEIIYDCSTNNLDNDEFYEQASPRLGITDEPF
jgi:hypothetical protein